MIKTNPLSNPDKHRFIDLYRDHTQWHYEGLRLESRIDSLIRDFPKRQTDIRYEYDVSQLDIRKTIDEIEAIYDESHAIQLRDVAEDVDTLIVGCGNRPLKNNRNTSIYDPFIGSQDDLVPYYENNIEYSKLHAHEESKTEKCVTLDGDLAKNPSIVVYFGDYPLPKILKSHSFKKIILEGCWFILGEQNRDLSTWENYIAPFTFSEIERLLKENGSIVTTYASGQPKASYTLEELRQANPLLKYVDYV